MWTRTSKRCQPRPLAHRARQRGATLIETLVAVLVLSIGILGIAGLQARALQNNQSAYERSQAVMLSYFALDAMRANLAAAKSGSYALDKTCEVPDEDDTLVEADHKAWMQALKDNLGDRDSTCGEIECTGDVCTVRIFWDDSRALSGEDELVVETTTRL
nr:type IV pilus modification protein PilV [uncultured Caldimonas sp.]